jgi:hypothetical protein
MFGGSCEQGALDTVFDTRLQRKTTMTLSSSYGYSLLEETPPVCRAEIELAERPNLVRYYKRRALWGECKRRLALQMRPLRYVIRISIYFGKTSKRKQEKIEQLTADVALLKYEVRRLKTERSR